MKIRSATAEDAARCAEISSLRPADELKAFLDDPTMAWPVIEDRREIVVGFGLINLWTWSGVAWIWDITIDKSERGQEYGLFLLDGMIQTARDMGARVLMDFDYPQGNDLNQLYFGNGFRICGSNDRWFPSGKDHTAVFYGYDL